MKQQYSMTMILSAIIFFGAACQITPQASVQKSSNTSENTQAGAYRSYDAAAVMQAATAGEVVLFFHAPWCPSCAALDKSITAGAATIPEGLTIFKTDYDSSQELKEKYGVTYQHTLVQVDAEGSMLTKWSGGSTLQSIIDHVQ